MNGRLLAAAEATEVGNPAVNIAIFGAFVAVTLVIVFRASKNNKTAADYYAGGRSFTGPQTGTAIAGDYLSAASSRPFTGHAPRCAGGARPRSGPGAGSPSARRAW